MGKNWIDISFPLRTGIVHWPGDPDIKIERIREIAKGAVCNVSAMSTAVHAATHMDGPLHFIANGKGLETLPLDATIGPARVIAIKDKESIQPDELRRHNLRRGERILFK